MSIEFLLLGGLAVIAGLVIGLLIGRISAPGDRQCERLREERDDAQRELERMRQQVDSHFGESARLFANLAHDYRALYEHFADSAGQLGLSEHERREILVSATKPLPSESDADQAAAEAEPAAQPTEYRRPRKGAVDFPAAHPEPMATGALNSPRAQA
jgi:uncharacterized membrane-anchored protein YhcB (DUF1043 family)